VHAATASITAAPRTAAGRLAYAALAGLLLAAIVFEAVKHGTGYWQIAFFGLAPDLALVYGAAPNLAKGQLHPRAVGLALLGVFGVVSLGYFIGALAWMFHISLDRAVGYGLRTRDGFQRA
jgi:hypothetical protein